MKNIAPKLVICISALLVLTTLVKADEWYDANNDGVADIVELPTFVVNGNDPETFDWNGYFQWLDENGIDEITYYSRDVHDYFYDSDSGGNTVGTATTKVSTTTTYSQQDKSQSCSAAVVTYVLQLLKGSTVTEASVRTALATNAGFSETKFETTGITKNELKSGLTSLMAANDITFNVIGKMEELRSTTLSSTTLDTENARREAMFKNELQNSDAVLFKGTFANGDGHSYLLQYDSATGNVLRIDPSDGTAAAFFTLDEAWSFAKINSHVLAENYIIGFKRG